MPRPVVVLWLCLCTLVLKYNDMRVGSQFGPTRPQNQGCGCLYNMFANMPMKEREKRACSLDCVYSEINGRCNNRCHNHWGQAIRPFGRLLKPDYCLNNGFDATRCAKDNSPLPNARLVTRALFMDRPKRDLDMFLTSAHMAFGQFLSHDFGRKNEPKPTDKNGVNLCGKNQCKRNAVCTPIDVFRGDPDFESNMCLRFQRSTRNDSPDHECKEQQNDVSSYLDLNTVYGGTSDEMILLRDARSEYNAYLNMTHLSQLNLGQQGKPLLPQLGNSDCRGKTDTIKCFLAGDKRVKEQPQLTAYHTIFAREHNRIVKGLEEVVGGCFTQERLFQEARKINIAQWQHIVYNEYLPLLLSDDNLNYWRLKLADYGYTYYYDKKINATTSNVFMTASFRFGHTQIPEFVALATSDFFVYDKPVFSEVFNNPTLVYNPRRRGITGIDAITFGMVAFSSEATDPFFNKQITRSFDAESKNKPSRDLEALDVQRGRDHALPGYMEWRRWCRLPTADSFGSLKDISVKHRITLSELYKTVEDIDLFVGGVLEIPHRGDLTGPTFSCLNAEQFHRARFGDRFWHEEKLNGFTRDQLQNIRQITSGKIFCDNLDSVTTMQPFTLAHPKSVARKLAAETASPWDPELVYGQKLKTDNERVKCRNLPGLDFLLWQEYGCC